MFYPASPGLVRYTNHFPLSSFWCMVESWAPPVTVGAWPVSCMKCWQDGGHGNTWGTIDRRMSGDRSVMLRITSWNLECFANMEISSNLPRECYSKAWYKCMWWTFLWIDRTLLFQTSRVNGYLKLERFQNKIRCFLSYPEFPLCFPECAKYPGRTFTNFL